MCKVTRKQIVDVSLLESIHAESEVVHETELIVSRPQQVEAIDECVDGCHCNSNISIREFVDKIVELPIYVLVKRSFWHLRKKTFSVLLFSHIEESILHAFHCWFRATLFEKIDLGFHLLHLHPSLHTKFEHF